MPAWRRGARVPRSAWLRSYVRRAEWAGRMAGMHASDIRRLRWRFWTSLHDGFDALDGAVIWRDGKLIVEIVVNRGVLATMCHELAHVAHDQGEKDPTGCYHDPHNEVFKVWEKRILRYCYRDRRRPPILARGK